MTISNSLSFVVIEMLQFSQILSNFLNESFAIPVLLLIPISHLRLLFLCPSP